MDVSAKDLQLKASAATEQTSAIDASLHGSTEPEANSSTTDSAQANVNKGSPTRRPMSMDSTTSSARRRSLAFLASAISMGGIASEAEGGSNDKPFEREAAINCRG
uniref:Uncharacterized protein n=2 Tax=Kalmanozyma brasiliensis (strain GHG001) TaxID=1365824 RepID=V5EGU7_KALBG